MIVAICVGWSELVNYMNESRMDSPEFLFKTLSNTWTTWPLLDK